MGRAAKRRVCWRMPVAPRPATVERNAFGGATIGAIAGAILGNNVGAATPAPGRGDRRGAGRQRRRGPRFSSRTPRAARPPAAAVLRPPGRPLFYFRSSAPTLFTGRRHAAVDQQGLSCRGRAGGSRRRPSFVRVVREDACVQARRRVLARGRFRPGRLRPDGKTAPGTTRGQVVAQPSCKDFSFRSIRDRIRPLTRARAADHRFRRAGERPEGAEVQVTGLADSDGSAERTWSCRAAGGPWC